MVRSGHSGSAACRRRFAAAAAEHGGGAMDERRWERIGAASGIVAALFLIVPGFAAPPPPHVDASVTKWVSYVADHRRAMLGQQVFGILGVIALVWFVAHLRHVLDRSEGHAEAFSSVVLVS